MEKKKYKNFHANIVELYVRKFFGNFSNFLTYKIKHKIKQKIDCYYCPNEPNMPRSYLSDEPGVRRGKRHKWDAIDQFYGRASSNASASLRDC